MGAKQFMKKKKIITKPCHNIRAVIPSSARHFESNIIFNEIFKAF